MGCGSAECAGLHADLVRDPGRPGVVRAPVLARTSRHAAAGRGRLSVRPGCAGRRRLAVSRAGIKPWRGELVEQPRQRGRTAGAVRVPARATGRATFERRVLVLGVGKQAARLQGLRSDETLGCRILGYVQAHKDEPASVPLGRRLQVTQRLVDLALALRADEIVVAMDDRRRDFPFDALLECKLAGIAIRPVLAFVERETGQIALDALRPSNFLFADGFPAFSDRQLLKRSLDLAVSLLLLALTWPVMLLAALAIGLESRFREPILYRQIRAGQHERPFSILKFRTMRVNAGGGLAQPNDPRITRVGRLLRETRIDELPQLVNVLRGEMSLVGPRPEQPHYVVELRAAIPFYGLRHLGQPSLTGWAQICYPYADSEESSREKLQYDLYYLKNASVGFDLLILLQTVHTILWGNGARQDGTLAAPIRALDERPVSGAMIRSGREIPTPCREDEK